MSEYLAVWMDGWLAGKLADGIPVIVENEKNDKNEKNEKNEMMSQGMVPRCLA